MKLEDLKELKQRGELEIFKEPFRFRRRNIWKTISSDNGRIDDEYIKKTIRYQVHSYRARTKDMDENQFYKITSRDYNILKNIVSPSA